MVHGENSGLKILEVIFPEFKIPETRIPEFWKSPPF